MHSLNTDPWFPGGDFFLPEAVDQDPSLAKIQRDAKVVREICEYTFGKVIDALGQASPEQAPEIAESVGLDVREKFQAFGDVMIRLAEATGDERFFRNVAEHVVARRHSDDLGFSNLHEDALAYWRCVAHLWSMLGENHVPPPRQDDARATALLRRFVSLQQVLALLGIESHDVPRDVQVSIAEAYWSAIVAVVPSGNDDLIDDAWALGQSEQSKASGGESIPWSDLHESLCSD